MESFASENGARLAAMQSARDKLDQRLPELRALESRLRQEQITGELLELITGTEALRRAPGSAHSPRVRHTRHASTRPSHLEPALRERPQRRLKVPDMSPDCRASSTSKHASPGSVPARAPR